VLAALLLTTAVAGCGEQDSPQATTEAIYGHLAAQEFEEACALIDPKMVMLSEMFADSCASPMAEDRTAEEWGTLEGASVDAAQVQVSGDSATVPQAALSFDGEPSSHIDVSLSLDDGKWFVVDFGY